MKDGFEHTPADVPGLFLCKSFLDGYLFKPIFAVLKKRPVRLRARTPPFHGGDTGSNPVRATKVLMKIRAFFVLWLLYML